MWYVMQVRTGTEENIRCQCQRLISSDILKRCFIPYYQQTRLLGTGDEIIPLSQEEVELLLKLGKEEQLVAISTGIIENDQVRILTGPLQGMEGYIRKINRHKRKAWVSIEMFGRSVDMEVGLEIIKKV